MFVAAPNGCCSSLTRLPVIESVSPFFKWVPDAVALAKTLLSIGFGDMCPWCCCHSQSRFSSEGLEINALKCEKIKWKKESKHRRFRVNHRFSNKQKKRWIYKKKWLSRTKLFYISLSIKRVIFSKLWRIRKKSGIRITNWTSTHDMSHTSTFFWLLLKINHITKINVFTSRYYMKLASWAEEIFLKRSWIITNKFSFKIMTFVQNDVMPP